MTYTTISTKGQVSIPDNIRKSSNLKPGDKVMFTPTPNKDVLQMNVLRKSSLDELYGCLHTPGMKYIPIEKAREMAADELAKTEWLDRGLILKK
jgi:AbrB family looped-hinge helix DNA binding protein